MLLVEGASVAPAAEEGHGGQDGHDHPGDESDDDDLRRVPAKQMRLFQLEKVAAD